MFSSHSHSTSRYHGACIVESDTPAVRLRGIACSDANIHSLQYKAYDSSRKLRGINYTVLVPGYVEVQGATLWTVDF